MREVLNGFLEAAREFWDGGWKLCVTLIVFGLLISEFTACCFGNVSWKVIPVTLIALIAVFATLFLVARLVIEIVNTVRSAFCPYVDSSPEDYGEPIDYDLVANITRQMAEEWNRQVALEQAHLARGKFARLATSSDDLAREKRQDAEAEG